MKNLIIFIFGLANALSVMGQKEALNQSFNFDFEQLKNGSPIGWNNFGEGNYKSDLDSNNVKNGRYAVSISSQGDESGYHTWLYNIPGNYPGNLITLSGYIKTEGVEGFAGLWMRLNPNGPFYNMKQEGLDGTTDWKRYEFTLPMNSDKTEMTIIGGMLVGKGKVWFDNLSVKIDGQDIGVLRPRERVKLPAEADTAFVQGSGIDIPMINESTTESLKVLGQVWGFVKYYHPTIASGDVNWDYELFRILPSILEAKNKRQRDEILTKWIAKLGPIEEGDGAVSDSVSNSVKLVPDLEWINTSNLSDSLSELLIQIKKAKRTGKHFYVSSYPGVGNPDFSSENSYPRMRVEDDGYRLLTLYRYWNIIQYFFPYKHLIDEDWKGVLREFIPKFMEAEDTQAYTLTILELVGRIHDTHANIWGNNPALENFFGDRYAAIEIQFIEEQPIITGYRHNEFGADTGLEIGDVLISINGESVDDFVKRMLKYIPASNFSTKLRDIAPKLLRTNATVIPVEVLRNGVKHSLVLKTYKPNILNIRNSFINADTSFQMLTDDIAYLNNSMLNPDDLGEYWQQIEHTKGIIIDNRNYPNQPDPNTLGGVLLPAKTPYAKISLGSIQEPGLFTLNDEPMSAGSMNSEYYKGKVVILVNELTESASEFLAMVYRAHPNATVIGSTTAGADGNVSPIMLPGGILTGMSGIGVYYPDGRETQRVGIVPDIKVVPTIFGIKSGRDEVLEIAVQFINGE